MIATPRQKALLAAMAARRSETDDTDDPIFNLLGELMRLEIAKIDGTPRAFQDLNLHTYTAALVKLRPSEAVLRALR